MFNFIVLPSCIADAFIAHARLSTGYECAVPLAAMRAQAILHVATR
jgi:hypothetical protein